MAWNRLFRPVVALIGGRLQHAYRGRKRVFLTQEWRGVWKSRPVLNRIEQRRRLFAKRKRDIDFVENAENRARDYLDKWLAVPEFRKTLHRDVSPDSVDDCFSE